MKTRLCLLLLVLLSGQVRALTKSQIAALDGHLTVGNERNDKIMILDRNVDVWNGTNNICWEYKLVKGKDGLKMSFPDFNDFRRVINGNGQVCLLICENPSGVALFNMETEYFDFCFEVKMMSAKDGILKKTSPHSAEILPDGNFAVADPAADDLGGPALRVVYGDNNNPSILQSIPFPGIHGVVWDHERQLLWAWGGTLRRYSYTNSTLTEVLPRYSTPSWAAGGHDLCAMDDQNKLMLTCGDGIGTFDITLGTFTLLYSTNNVPDLKIEAGKGADYDPVTGEIAYVKQDSPGAQYTNYPGFRSFKIRNPAVITNGKMKERVYVPNQDAAWYKARWFRHRSFSYGEQQLPTNDGLFVSQTNVPAFLQPGGTATVSITMKNTGTNVWSTVGGYKLCSQNPQSNTTWTGSSSVELTRDVAPNEEYTFTFDITAPSTPGIYDFQWQMLDSIGDDAGWFGSESANVSIYVGVFNLATSGNLSADCGGFQAGKEVGYLHDENIATPTAKAASSIWVEYDFGAEYTITLAKLFGDSSGSWNSQAWTLQAWNGSSYVDVFTNSSCFGLQWFEKTVNVTASKAKVTINGTASGTEVFELQIMGTISSNSPAGGYAAWASSNSVTGSITDDDDGDGLSNLMEYALNGNPKAAGDTKPTLIRIADSFEYTYLQRNNDPELSYSVAFSTNLISGVWTLSGDARTNFSGGVCDEVIHTIPVGPQSYIRLKVTKP